MEAVQVASRCPANDRDAFDAARSDAYRIISDREHVLFQRRNPEEPEYRAFDPAAAMAMDGV